MERTEEVEEEEPEHSLYENKVGMIVSCIHQDPFYVPIILCIFSSLTIMIYKLFISIVLTWYLGEILITLTTAGGDSSSALLCSRVTVDLRFAEIIQDVRI